MAAAVAVSTAAPINRWRFWLGVAALFVLALWLLNEILLPFVVGAVVAYFFDPVVARLQRLGLSRTLSTATVTILAALIAIGAATAVVPPLFAQLEELVAKAPIFIVKAAARIQPMIEPIRARLGLPPFSLSDVQAHAAQWAGEGLSIAGRFAGRVAQRGAAIINLLALLFLTPVVTFYLLRDWPNVLAAIDSALPLDHADTVRKLARQSNAAVAGYVRGQALVCLCLGTIYAVGLTIVGLQFGFVIGMVAGFISFIPFVGTLVGATTALGMALAQFPPDWISVGEVAVVFLIGHLLEGNVLSPKLVGDRVGLHPVWIMFALLAGGSLFGFVGVLVAVPIAAVIGVVARHLLDRYHESSIYRGSDAA
ncbi:MAG: AI-2E family transporter [Alphaproteobacteria bacterium]|nr:AI-2E family transporter [Alphaproteobacteria bacterium]